MKLLDLRILLLKMGMSVAALARELHCSRMSIYGALYTDLRPGIKKKLAAWYNANKGKAA